jgi:hypothetical protein
MRKDAEVFIDVLGLNQIDLPGFSVGGIVAQSRSRWFIRGR